MSSWKYLIKTFLFPVITIIWGTVGVISEVLNSWELGFREIFCPLIVLGGILSVILTITLKLDTQRYFFKRIAVFLIIHIIIRYFGVVAAAGWIAALLSAVEVIFQIIVVQDEDTTSSERVVMAISDPMLYQFFDMLVLEISAIAHIS